MDRVLNSKNDRIYEIYRACRLCGAGAGYKMPIIQNVVDLEVGVELRQKIKECIRIEVNHTDRMPPLICEYCVDKLNAFYEFMKLCHRTDLFTRRQLGLPLQSKESEYTNKDKENVECGPVPIEESETLSFLKLRIKKTRRELKKIRKIDKKRKFEKMLRYEMSHRESRDSSSVSSEEVGARRARRDIAPRASVADCEPKEPQQSVPLLKCMKLVLTKTDDPPHIHTANLKRTREKETKDTPPTKKVKIPSAPSRPGPRSSKQPRETIEPAPVAKPPTRPTPNKTATKETTPKSTPKELTKPTPSKHLTTKLSKEPPSKIATKEPPSKTPSKTTAKEVTPKSTAKDTTKPTPKSKGPKQKETNKSSPPEPTSKTTAKDVTSKSTTSKETAVKATSKETAVKATSKETAVKATSKEQTKPPEAPKVYECAICDLRMKTVQGLAIHNSHKHLPSFTNPKQACNACQEWFESSEAAGAHHRAHRDGVPYKCTRCYGYYKLVHEFDSHFGLGECLSLYEVPDVKCWDCWKMFPTTRLLETHKCGGEDARPGGKCKNCSRVYSTLKSLTRHEAACTYRRKADRVPPPEIPPPPPCAVRVARCDALLRGGAGAGGTVRVAGVPHTYGLDSAAHYPFLQASTSTSSESSHMVSIDQNIKDEFSAKGDFLDDNSDTDSQHNVDSLSNISLRTIIHTDEGEAEADGDLRDTDIGRKINSIIDNLTNEHQTSCSYHSDCVLGKNCEKTTSQDAKVNYIKSAMGGKDNMTSCSDTDSVKERILVIGKVSTDCNDIGNGATVKDTVKTSTVKSDSADDKIDDLTEKYNVDKAKTGTIDKIDATEVLEPAVKLDGAIKLGSATEKSDDKRRDSSAVSEKVSEESATLENVTKQMDVDSVIEAANEESKAEVNEAHEPSNEVSNGTDGSDSVHVSVNEENDSISNVDTSVNDQSMVNDSREEVVPLRNDKLDSTNQYTDADVRINKTESEKMDVDQNDRTDSAAVSGNIDIDMKSQHSPSIEDFSKIDEITNKILQETESQKGNDNDVSQNDLPNDKNSKHETYTDNRTSDPEHILNDILEGESAENDEASNNYDQERNPNAFTDRATTEIDSGSLNESHLVKDDHSESPGVASSERNLNGQDVGDDDTKLMAEIGGNDPKIENNIDFSDNADKLHEISQNLGENDEKSEENVTKTTNHFIDDLLKKPDNLRSLELDAVSDDDFDFE